MRFGLSRRNFLRAAFMMLTFRLGWQEMDAEKDMLATGKFGQALDLRPDSPFWVEAAFNREYMEMPLTVECWVKLRSRLERNIILADGYAVSPYQIITNHWMLYSLPATGALTAKLGNMQPSEIATSKDIADGGWHYIAMTLEPNLVTLYVDAQTVSRTQLTPQVVPHALGNWSNEGPLFVGGYLPDALTCDGLIDEVRISRVSREIDQLPGGPFEADAATIALWHFDEPDPAGRFLDSSKTHNPVVIKELLPTLDENDRREFGVTADPFSRSLVAVEWEIADQGELPASATSGAEEMLLHGAWDCVGVEPRGKSDKVMFEDPAQWAGSFPANVPCTIQTALLDNGLIDDPMVMMNNLNSAWVADKEWWLRKTFAVPDDWRGEDIALLFDGVDYRATFWLNGYRLGQHEGMFGGPEFDVSRLLRYGGQQNTLIVCLDPAPPNYEDTFKNNVAYGWHYVKLVTLGIWRPVRLQMRRCTALDHPFLRTAAIDASGVTVDLSLDCWHWGDQTEKLTLEARLIPKNFDGRGYAFRQTITVEPGANEFGFSGRLEGARLWWPVDMGEPNLYWFECVLQKDGQMVDRYRSHWGARAVEMRPYADGPNPHLYNWQFAINGQPIWIKGANWCLTDALLRMDRQRDARFIELARHAHIQLLRVWGGGPIENDELYDLCDEMGVMIQQEFAMLGFHRLQNVPSAHATDMTHHMVKRLRNRPSLAMWAGANEISGQGRIVEVLGRQCLELDGTRPFHRTCPYGGDVHWHDVYWGQRPLLDYRKVATGRLKGWSPGIGGNLPDGPTGFTEFGLCSPANHETWRRILPPDEWQDWPPRRDAIFIHHTPTFEYTHVDKMTLYARDFLEPGNFPDLIKGMQLSQGLGMKLLIESMRIRKPQTTTTYFYKLTENYPSCSWATLDYYGVPKRSHYDVREAYAPVHVMALFEDWSSADDHLGLSVHAANDTAAPVEAALTIRLFDGQLNVVEADTLDVAIPVDRAIQVADKTYALPPNTERPLFLCLDLTGEQGLIDRNWYYFDFADRRGTLLERPQTTLAAEIREENDAPWVTIQNTGDRPALSVELNPGEASNTYYADQGGLWLDPGERITVALRRTAAVDGDTRELKNLWLSAWNVVPRDLLRREEG